jgi:alpha-mannosidase
MRPLPLLLAGLLASNVAAQPAPNTPQKPDRPVLYYVPHTHWEGAVFKTREDYLTMGLPHITQALALLKKYPDYKFTLDQVAYFRPYLERYPEDAPAFRKFVAEGRLGIAGGMDVMPDDVKPGGEIFVRQMQYGKRYCREALGTDPTVAWMVDTFGHHPQMPQLLAQAGYKSFWFCRGVPRPDFPAEFRWRGIDGTEIPSVWLPGFYGLFYGPPRDPAGFRGFFQQRFHALDPFAKGPERVGLAGVDVSEPEAHVPPLVAGFNQAADRPFDLRFSIPSDYEAAVLARKDLPVESPDLNPIFQGTYSSRIELKQATREFEARMLTAEKLSVLAQLLGQPANTSEIWRAWEPILFDQTHDLASGVMTDYVYADVLRDYAFSNRLAGQITDRAWDTLSAKVDTRGEGTPVLVFNQLGWPRTEGVETEVSFAEDRFKAVEVRNAAGLALPVQIVSAERRPSGNLLSARIAFLAKSVPALGYATYHVSGRELPPIGPINPPPAAPDVLETDLFRLTVNRGTGEITKLLDKAQNWQALSRPGNIVARQQDRGDLWELYHGLDGAQYVGMKNRQPVPTGANSELSSNYPSKDGSLVRGPVFSEYAVSHPLANGSFATHIRVYNGVRRVEISTDLLNNEKYVRYQVLFPTDISGGRNTQEIPFGSLERPEGVEYPAQAWSDYSGGGHGLALLNAGMPGNLVSDGTLLLSLLRSHNLGAYGFGGGFEPGMSSDTGFELGVPRSFRYAVVPHAGTATEAGVYRDALEFNHPLLVRKAEAHPGSLPPAWGLVEISQPNVVLTSFNPGKDGAAVLRLYEAAGKPTKDVRIHLNARVSSAREANLMEDAGKRLEVRDNSVRFDLHPFEIKTIILKLGSPRSGQ